MSENVGAGGMPQNGAKEFGQQPDFRVVQPEYDEKEQKTIFKDVGAVWKNISQKTGKEFYTLKVGKLRLLMFENKKLEQ
jgi:uncharacterized protein (DUF736 family)